MTEGPTKGPIRVARGRESVDLSRRGPHQLNCFTERDWTKKEGVILETSQPLDELVFRPEAENFRRALEPLRKAARSLGHFVLCLIWREGLCSFVANHRAPNRFETLLPDPPSILWKTLEFKHAGP